MTPIERFLAKIRIASTGCWEWRGARDKSGYGRFRIGSTKDATRRVIRPHRFAYNAYRGEVPAGMELDHLCRNRGCANPGHLEAVTHLENSRRGKTGEANRGRQLAKSHCSRGHLLSGDNLYTTPKGFRVCKICQRLRGRALYWRDIEKSRARGRQRAKERRGKV